MKTLLLAACAAAVLAVIFSGVLPHGGIADSSGDNCIDLAAQSSDWVTLTPDPTLEPPCGSNWSTARFKAAAMFCPRGRKAVMIYVTPLGTPLHSCPPTNSQLVARYLRGLYEGNYQQPLTFATPQAAAKFIGFGRWKVMTIRP